MNAVGAAGDAVMRAGSITLLFPGIDALHAIRDCYRFLSAKSLLLELDTRSPLMAAR